jgi:hypothetical protein
MKSMRKNVVACAAALVAMAGLGGFGEPAKESQPAADAGPAEVFPFVRVDRDARAIEIDAEVPIDAHQYDARSGKRLDVFLEVVLCSRDTKEHEALAVTRARPSDVHAALLLLGLEPGRPGAWSPDPLTKRMMPTEPLGPELEVMMIYDAASGERVSASAASLARRVPGGETLAEAAHVSGGWVFAGSVERERQGAKVYAADDEGTIVGLTTFGTETVAWRGMYSPQESVHAPEWAAAEALPPRGTKVVVRISVK